MTARVAAARARAKASIALADEMSRGPLMNLPRELLLMVVASLPTDDLFALECTCRAAAAIALEPNVKDPHMLLDVRIGGPSPLLSAWAERAADSDVRVEFGIDTCQEAVRKADATTQKKGIFTPVYQSMRVVERSSGPAFEGLVTRLAMSNAEKPPRDESGLNFSGWLHWPTPAQMSPDRLTRPHPIRRNHYRLAMQLPRGCDAKCLALSFDLASLHVETLGEPMMRRVNICLQSNLRYLDLSRMVQVKTLNCSHLYYLVEARLPRGLRVADFCGCDTLETIRAPGGCPDLLSIDFTNCSQLKDASLRALNLSSCEELYLPWCKQLKLSTIEYTLKRATSVVQLDLRGMRITAVALNGLSRAAWRSLAGADFDQANWLSDMGIYRLVHACPALKRCRIRHAEGVGRETREEVQALVGQRCRIANLSEREREREIANVGGAAAGTAA